MPVIRTRYRLRSSEGNSEERGLRFYRVVRSNSWRCGAGPDERPVERVRLDWSVSTRSSHVRRRLLATNLTFCDREPATVDRWDGTKRVRTGPVSPVSATLTMPSIDIRRRAVTGIPRSLSTPFLEDGSVVESPRSR